MQYRDRLTIQTRTEDTQDVIPKWSDVVGLVDYPCNVVSGGGGETVKARQVEGETHYTVSMPYVPIAIDATMRVKILTGHFANRLLDIDRVLVVDKREVGRMREYEMACKD